VNRDDLDVDEKTGPLRLLENEAEDLQESRRLSIRLDWWRDENDVGSSLKTWAGQQKVSTIARAMLHAASNLDHVNESWLNVGTIAHDPDRPNEVVEPFYFDARRFAHALDVGFSLDVQSAETVAYPAVEVLSLIGLQRFRPAAGPDKWSFDYWTWSVPLEAPVAASIACGSVPTHARSRYRFRLRFRDDQKRYKAFGFTTPVGDET
jgi:CRISPR-associated protein Csb3